MLSILFDVFAWLLALSAMILPTTLMLGLIVPFQGALVRLWANYTPKEGTVRLEDGSATPTEKSPGFFGMLKRVHRIEGWRGLYKGFMPSLISVFVAAIAVSPVVIFATAPKILPDGRVYIPPNASWLANVMTYGFVILPTMFLLPLGILTNRAITTAHILPSFSPRTSLDILLSPIEHAQPLRLYLGPGVALSTFLPALVIPTLNVVWQLIAPRLPRVLWNAPLLGVALPMVIVTSCILTPLKVAHVRLTIQRQGEAEPAVADALPGDEVLNVRTEEAPYTGLVDCVRCIAQEEGWRVLLRAWWLTALGLGLQLVVLAFMPQF